MTQSDPITRYRSVTVEAALYATVAAGLVAACAQALPSAVRCFVVLAVGACWLGCLGVCIVSGARSYRRWLTHKTEVALAAIGVAAIVVAIIGLTQLSLVRLIHGREALIWNNDWRWALTHAQSIARSGGLESSIDYAGYPIMYHVGPAWFAGAFGHITGTGVPALLFGVMPAASTVAAAVALFSIVRTLRASVPVALFAAGIAMIFPMLPNHAPWHLDVFSLSPDIWHYSAAQMLNSNFALGVVFASVALLFGRQRHREIVIGIIGLATIPLLKPQYFISTGVLVAVAAIASLLPAWRPRIVVGRTIALGLALTVFTLCAVVPFTPWGALRVVGLPALAAILVVAYIGYASPVRRRSAALLLAGVGALALSMVLAKFLPRIPASAQGLAFSSVSEMVAEYGTSFILVFVLACVILRASSEDAVGEVAGHVQFARLVYVSLALFITVNALTDIVSDPANDKLLTEFIGVPMDGWSGIIFNLNMETLSLPPLRTLLVLGSIAAIASLALRRIYTRTVLLVSTCGLLLLPLYPIAVGFADPVNGYEASEDVDLWRSLEAIPIEDSMLLANDLADPAQGFARGGQGTLQTGYFGHSLYVGQLANRFGLPDALQRMRDMHSFFGTPWSPAHERWLQTNGITHVLVHVRCPPVWQDVHDLPFELVARHGNWTAYRFVRRPVPAGPPMTRTAREQPPHKWGERACVGI